MNRKTIDRNRAIIVLLVQTGLRNSELRALTLSDLDFNGGTLTVRHGKGDKARTVPFPQKSREAVRRYLESGTRPKSVKKTALLFGTDADEFGHTTNGAEWHELSTVALNAIVKSYVNRITGKVIHCHTLRHMACSLWDDLGVSMRDAQQALGHASIAMTERVYTHVLNKGKAAKSINNAFACANM